MNHYELAINDLIEHIKADKGIVQPWRNYCIKHLMEAQAHICKGLSTTNRQPTGTYIAGGLPLGEEGKLEYNPNLSKTCTCPVGCLRRDCPVHGRKG